MRSTRDFFIGVLTGATIGLLTAPRTGRESRQWLQDEYDKRMQSASGSSGGTGLKEQLTNAFEQVKSLVNKYINEKKAHDERLTDTGRFDYQRSREQNLSGSIPNSEEALSAGTSGLYQQRSQSTGENRY